jgi:hypothetical protein
MKAIFFLLMVTMAGPLLAADRIYKVVDEHGNVTYTDQKPSEQARPIDLPEISVLNDDDEPPVTPGPVDPEPEAADERLEFRVQSPGHDEWITDSVVNVDLQSNINLPPAAQIVIYIDDQPQEPIHALSTRYDHIEPGEHALRAELQTGSGRVLARTETVRFTVLDNERSPIPES